MRDSRNRAQVHKITAFTSLHSSGQASDTAGGTGRHTARNAGSFMYFIIAAMPPFLMSSNAGRSSGSSLQFVESRQVQGYTGLGGSSVHEPSGLDTRASGSSHGPGSSHGRIPTCMQALYARQELTACSLLHPCSPVCPSLTHLSSDIFCMNEGLDMADLQPGGGSREEGGRERR